MRILRQISLLALSLLHLLAAAASASFKSRTALQAENLALRHQLTVLRRSVKRPKLITADRLLWAWLSQVWIDWRSSLLILKPETVIGWHRKGFRMFWTWKVRRGKPGRPTVPKDVRKLIRKLSRENPLWGAPRIHGELLKLGVDVGETSVAKYMPPHRNPPSQTWRTFLENHLHSTVSEDFFTVPTIRFQVLYVFLVLAHDRRRIVHFNVTSHPTALTLIVPDPERRSVTMTYSTHLRVEPFWASAGWRPGWEKAASEGFPGSRRSPLASCCD